MVMVKQKQQVGNKATAVLVTVLCHYAKSPSTIFIFSFELNLVQLFCPTEFSPALFLCPLESLRLL